MKISKMRLYLFAVFITTMFAGNLYSQIDYKFITGAQKGELDTLARETNQKISKETAGLLEKEIDPESYIVGPNDLFEISINSAKPKLFDSYISPDGSLLISSIGRIDLKNKTLAEAYKLILAKASTVYKSDEIDIILKDVRKFKVTVSGSVGKPNMVPATAVDRVSEVIDRAGGLKFDASLRNIVLIRDETERIKVDLLRYYLLADNSANPTVLGGDKIIIPPSNDKESIRVYGDVASAGEFEFIKGDSLSTLLQFGMGFLESAFLDSVEIARVSGGVLDRYFLDLNTWKGNLFSQRNLPGDFALESGDRVFVRTIPNLRETDYAVITGEVRFPGKYAVVRNKDKVSDLIRRSGGYTSEASLEAIEFIRQSEKEKPNEEMERLQRTAPSEMSESESRYFQARVREKRGVMAIDFRKIRDNQYSQDNITLMNKDSIIVPSKKNFVNVQGRVANPGLVVYNPQFTYMDYVLLAGGFGFRADEKETIITKNKGEQFLAQDMNYVIEPGDVILVPPEKEYTFMEILTTSLTILSQLLTIIAVVFAISKK